MTRKNAHSNWTSFSLLNLMALATIIAVWLPWWLAREEPKRLQTEIDLMNQALGILVINDPSEFVAARLPNYSYGMETWRFHVPEGMDVDACLAIEGIHHLALPEKSERLKLPSGQHEMSLLINRSQNKGFSFEVHLDGVLQMNLTRDPEWLDSGGSSSQSNIAMSSTAYDLSKSLMMKRLIFSPVLRTNQQDSIYLDPDLMAAAKGCCLWLQSADYVAEPAPEWIDETNSRHPQQLGMREGVRLRPQNSKPGLQIHHPQSMTRRDPVATVFMEFESDEADLSLSTRSLKTGTWKFSDKPNEFVKLDLHSKPERRQNFYLIHEFNSNVLPGAKPPVPIVEIFFDLDHPDDIGFRLVRPENGIAVDRWKLRVVHHSGQFWKTLITKDEVLKSDDYPNIIDLIEFPQIQYKEAPHRAIEIRSLIEDLAEWEQLKVPRNQRFKSMPQRHTWLVPDAPEDSTIDLSVKVSANDEGSTPIPGGPVITEVILDIDKPDDSIHWYRIDVQPFDD